MKLRRTTHFLGALALTLAAAQPALAQEATPWPELMMKMADKNKDGMISRQEFLDQMGRIWDKKHAEMMKADKSMKAGMMTMAQFKQFAPAIMDPLNIGG